MKAEKSIDRVPGFLRHFGDFRFKLSQFRVSAPHPSPSACRGVRVMAPMLAGSGFSRPPASFLRASALVRATSLLADPARCREQPQILALTEGAGQEPNGRPWGKSQYAVEANSSGQVSHFYEFKLEGRLQSAPHSGQLKHG